jgi:hypothetical protein
LPPAEHSLEAARILIGAIRQADLLAQERPEPPRGMSALVERERVVAAGAVPSRADPPGIRQSLEMAADRGLGELQDGAQLADSQLLALEHQQHPAPGRVRKRSEVIEDRGFHP